jgi:protein gp37
VGDKSAIAWTDSTWNPVRGCARVSAGCENCYAERHAHRGIGGYAGLTRATSRGPTWTGEIRLVPEKLDEPLRWRRPRRIFVNSMSDLFHEGVPDDYIDRVFAVMALAPQHTFQILTKRPERMQSYVDAVVNGHPQRFTRWAALGAPFARMVKGEDKAPPRWPLPNVWLGVSVENQATADERIPLLLQTPAAARFVSYEPALGPVDFVDAFEWGTCSTCEGSMSVPAEGGGQACPACFDCPAGQGNELTGALIDWIIVGGESGPGARPFDVAWARETIRQCEGAGVAVFVKQLGAKPRGLPFGGFLGGFYDEVHFDGTLDDRKGADPTEWPADLRRQDFPA